YTSHTITNPAELTAELARVRAQGYAIDDEEYEESLCCAAAPVRDHAGQVIAAIGIAGPSHRVTPTSLERLLPEVVRAGRAVSRNLGYVDFTQRAVGR
ncbi:MAG: IclR family transcriptional regulator C-terminal domain-containing protein, partial [Candidatus Dormibacteraeota bacterium]|nr:IclR family transcriptional regulator C-terminal domain-containing protein [Candidatus Dormibacteraeota bacterium]